MKKGKIMNWYKKYVMAEKVQMDDSNFSWVRCEISPTIKTRHVDFKKEFVNEEDLYIVKQEGNDWSYGYEDDPHITVKFGIDFDEPDKVIDSLKGERGGKIQAEDIDIFDNKEEYDVLVLKCNSEALNRLNKKLTNDLNIKDKYSYKPHITIGYFKKGKAKKYEPQAMRHFLYYLEDGEFDFDEVIFQDRNDKDTVIKLD